VFGMRPHRGAVTRTVVVYTDGACSGNPGVGAWAYRVEWPDGALEEGAGASPMTTNNREELKAVREGLRAVLARIDDDLDWHIAVRTDSLGVINWLTRRWKRKANLDLYPTIDPLVDGRVRFEHVRGHAGEPGNERVDALAVAAVAGQLAGVPPPSPPRGELPLT
jgi:ribonuclease HI